MHYNTQVGAIQVIGKVALQYTQVGAIQVTEGCTTIYTGRSNTGDR